MARHIGRVKPIDPGAFDAGERTDVRLALFEDAFGAPIEVPFIVLRGVEPGPVFGVSAAVHGDELNGIRIIHELVRTLDPKKLRGTVLCAPVVNVPAYRAGQRRFPDGTDLNHSFPGKKNGRTAEQYAKAFSTVFLEPIEYLVDIHTASEGRINSFYVRADLDNGTVSKMAELMNPDITLNVKASDHTLRGTARRRGIAALTAEAGNPRTFQDTMVDDGVRGIRNLLAWLDMIDDALVIDDQTIVCSSSQWLYTRSGGVLDLLFELRDHVEAKQVIARTLDPFGNVQAEYRAPHSGIVIGMARNPVAVPGTRFCHLGRLAGQ